MKHAECELEAVCKQTHNVAHTDDANRYRLLVRPYVHATVMNIKKY